MSIHYKSLIKFVKFVIGMCLIIGFISSFKLDQKLPNRSFVRLNYIVPIHKKHCNVIVREREGRLGNTLFQFATAYGLSLDHSCRLYLGPNITEGLSEYFEINLPDLLTESEVNRISPIEYKYNHCKYFRKLFQPNKSQNIQLIGYWQVHKYFVNHTDEIRNQLRFKKTILDKARHFIKTKIISTVLNLVGIHIRRGDFLGLRPISSDKFIFDAMNYFRRKYDSVKFIIVSDDKLYCRKVFGKRNDTFITPYSFTPGDDMALLTLCNHVVITVGTYGWWAGFLLYNRTGEVLVDTKPNHSPIDVDCEGSIFFPSRFSFLNMTI